MILKQKIASFSLSCLVATIGLTSLQAQNSEIGNSNWGQWRGPTGNGIALQGNPPTEWSESNNVKWKIALPGSGHATPIIWEEKVLVMTAVPGNGGVYDFKTIALNRENGEVIWEKLAKTATPHERGHQTNTQSSGSPITDGEHIISFFGSRGLYCYDMDGNEIWQKDMGIMNTFNRFGEGASPALYGDVLVVLWDNEDDSYIYAFDKNTGEELWKTARDEGTTWSTPYVLEFEGKLQVVVNATNAVRSYDMATGEQLWQCAGPTMNAIPSIVADANTVYALSGYQGNSAMAIQLGGSGDITDSAAIRWTLSRNTPYVPSALLYDDYLFFYKGNSGILSVANKNTGELYYSQERIAGLSGVYASPVGVSDRVYLAGQNGTTVVIEKSGELNILATNVLDDAFDASPAIVGDEIFLRGHEFLYSIAAE